MRHHRRSSRIAHAIVDALEPRTLLAATVGGPSPENLVSVGGTLYFTVDDGIHGRELWKSDGTPAGVSLVKDIKPGRGDGILSSVDPAPTMLGIGNTLYFSADDGASGRELWKTNGTPGSTLRVTDINPGAAGANPSRFTNVNGTLFFGVY